MNREDPGRKFIHVYDLRRESFVRRITHDSEKDEAFAFDQTARIVAYACNDVIKIKLIRLPNSEELMSMLRPRFNMARMKINPAIQT